jgi:hypothetical protein
VVSRGWVTDHMPYRRIRNRSSKYLLVFKSNPTLSASQRFSKGLIRPDPLPYLGFWQVGRSGEST